MKPYSIFPLQGKDQYIGAVAIEKKKEATETEKTKIYREEQGRGGEAQS